MNTATETPVEATTEHWCPRRGESVHQPPGPDEWDNRGGIIGQEDLGLSCSYCGSLHPDTFMNLVRAGWVVGPTDKSYKVYLSEPVTDELRTEKKTRWSNGNIGRAVREAALAAGASEAEADAITDDHWRTHEEPYVAGHRSAKFYFQHLSAEQQDEFIALHNSRQMSIGYPGRFYVAPYFCGTGEKAASDA